MVGSVLLLPAELPALGLQLQVTELPLVECGYRSLCWQDGVEVIAIPLQAVSVKVLAMLHGDEVFFQEDADAFHYGVPGHSSYVGDGVVAGMAGVRLAILNQQQVGVHHEGRGRKVQQENFIGEGEKFPALGRQKISGEGVLF